MKNGVIIILLFTIVSCIVNKKVEFTSCQINIPDNLISMVHDKEILLPDFVDNYNKLIIYFDSVGCSSCQLRDLVMWKDFISDNISSLNISIIIFPKNFEETLLFMTRLDFDFPVFYDLNGDFERDNPDLPKDSKFHTFLLDR